MQSPRLPHYYYLPLALISFLFTFSVNFTMCVGIGSWSHNQVVNWGLGWFQGVDFFTMMYINIALSTLPIIMVTIYFIRQFLKRRELPIIRGLLLAILGFVVGLLFAKLVTGF
ncbi:hypothetical protein [Neolewinella agarilytica]|uniref:Uncharacterized protein n=1 Tax=Neolewinella agarilytica TaxID=478744 RepID=A0A1H9AVG0_9BACT|nr:hypothetical protein [Neolewinella agarilytica]SEP80481.1 hypothetical protein SAMN05444359_102235 [Neolewinella agarilytica]